MSKKKSRTRQLATTPNQSTSPTTFGNLFAEPWVQCLVIFCLAGFVFFPALGLTWIWDDDQYVYENPLLDGWNGLYRIWCVPSDSPQYYPVVFSTFWVLKQTFGLSALAFHATNVLLHAVNAVLCFLVLRQLKLRAAFWISLAFAIHPIQVETVAWVTELKNVLSATFYGCAWLLLWPMMTHGTGRQGAESAMLPKSSNLSAPENPSFSLARIIARYTVAILCFSFALLSKSVTATLPAAILVAIWFVDGRISWKQWIWCTPLFALGIFFGLRTATLEKEHVGASGIDWDYSLVDRFGIAARGIMHYTQQAILPIEQMFFYPRFDPSANHPWAIGAMILCSLLACVATYFALKKGIRGPLACAAFFVGSAFPALGFLNVYPHRFSFVADHFVYIPIIGLLCCTWTALHQASDRLLTRTSRAMVARLPLVLFLSYYALMVWAYLPTFHNKLSLWETTLSRNPTSIAAAQSLGLEYVLAGRAREAVDILKPISDSTFDQHISLQNLGLAYNALGRHADARIAYLRATEVAPNHVRAWLNLGALHLTGSPQQLPENRIELAREYYEKAWELEPLYESALALGGVAAQLGENEQSQAWFAQANDFPVDDLEMRLGWAEQLLLEGEPEQASQIVLGTRAKWPDHPAVLALEKRIQQTPSKR